MRSRVFVSLVLLSASALTGLPASAGPGGIPAGPGGRATSNVRLLTNLPTGTGVGGDFLGSTYFMTSADSAWFNGGVGYGVTGGLLALDVSAPESPTVVGALPIGHQQNEDLSLSGSRKLAVISQQPTRAVSLQSSSPCLPGRIYLVDISVPTAMRPTAPPLLLPAQVGTAEDGRSLCGPGHTASFVGGGDYLWVSGSRDGKVYVVDVRDAAAPSVVGSFATPAGLPSSGYKPGAIHDVDVDRFGDVWVAGSGGTTLYRVGKDPLRPQLLASMKRADSVRAIQLIHHGSQRLDRDTVVIAEEDYQSNCASSAHEDGSLQTWRIDRKSKRLVQVGSYDAPRGADDSGPLSEMCSSHWFTINKHKVVADAWYGAGVRFVDISDPRHPRPIGAWRGDSTVAGQARFVPGRPDLVYVADYMRGLDVVQIDKGGLGARTTSLKDEKPVSGTPVTPSAPGPGSALSGSEVSVPGLRFKVTFQPHEDFGWACAVPTHH